MIGLRNLIATLLVLPFPLLTFAAPPSQDPAFFPLMAWNHVPNDPAVVAKMKDAGLTVAGFANPDTLPLLKQHNLKAILYDARAANYDWRNVDAGTARKNVESLVKEHKDDPTILGYYLRDEPPAGFFPGLEKVASVIRELHPGAWPYINLFPNYATPGQLESKDYQDYLDKFSATCKPPVLSYDNYFLMAGGDHVNHYYTNLESVRAQAIKTKVPFWNIVLANAHFGYAEPSRASLLLQAYTTLAYGGRGIAYFTYFAPHHGNYRDAPIDQFGHETPTWSYLQNANLQVQKLAPTLNRLASNRVYHFSPTPGCQSPPADSWVVSAGNPNFMAGEFTNEDGTQYVMIVNKSLTSSAPVGLQLRTAAKSVQQISPYTGQPTPYDGEYVWLQPGGGALLRLNR